MILAGPVVTVHWTGLDVAHTGPSYGGRTGYKGKWPRLRQTCWLLFSCCSLLWWSLELLELGFILESENREMAIPTVHHPGSCRSRYWQEWPLYWEWEETPSHQAVWWLVQNSNIDILTGFLSRGRDGWVWSSLSLAKTEVVMECFESDLRMN